MAFPLFKITGRVQQDHILYGEDAMNLGDLGNSLDPRVVHYCKILEAHKKECPICSWPRFYPKWRKFCQLCIRVFKRKVF